MAIKKLFLPSAVIKKVTPILSMPVIKKPPEAGKVKRTKKWKRPDNTNSAKDEKLNLLRKKLFGGNL